jgi:hypothetical protein
MQILECGASSFPLEVVAGRDGVSMTLNFGPHHHELFGLGIRHRCEHCVDNAENCSRRPDPQRQRQDGSDRKTEMFEQSADAEADVLSDESTHVASLL